LTSRTRNWTVGPPETPEIRTRVRILGIDPGSYATGYGVVDHSMGRLREVECGAIRPHSKKQFLQRLAEVHEALSLILIRFRPDEVAVENPFHARNAKTAIQLGGARAAALLPVVKAGIPVFEYAPREVKLAVVGYGHAEKVQVARMVAVLLNRPLPPRPFDAADALAVAICHAHRQTNLRLSQQNLA